MAVPTVNIQKPKRFKVVFVNIINHIVPAMYKQKHVISQLGPESNLLETSDRKRSKSKSSPIHVLCDDVICFRPAKKYHSSLHWECTPFFGRMQSECKTSSKRTPKRRKPSMTWQMDTKTRPKGPKKT